MRRTLTKNNMLEVERRKGKERRAVARYGVTIDVEWEDSRGRHSGTVSDISEAGCFVLCTGDVEDSSAVKIFLPLSDGMKVQFNGRISNHLIEVGFAAKFVDLTSAQKEFLASLIAMQQQ